MTINGRPSTVPAGSSVRELLDLMNFTYPKIFVKINGSHIEEGAYETTIVHEEDAVQVIHLMAGG